MLVVYEDSAKYGNYTGDWKSGLAEFQIFISCISKPTHLYALEQEFNPFRKNVHIIIRRRIMIKELLRNPLLARLYSKVIGIKKTGKGQCKIETASRALISNTKCVVRSGVDNYISIGKNSRLRNCSFIINGSGNRIEIGENVVLNDTEFWMADDGNLIVIGNYTTTSSITQFATLEGTSITLGEDCMLADKIYFRTSDSHSILKDGIRINPAKSIKIGNHVWIGTDVKILKGSEILDNSIIGANTIVTKAFNNQGQLLVGIPAKSIQENITWDRRRI